MRLAPPFRAQGDHIAVDLPGARALFTTRRGGVSEGPYTSLNLGLWTEDESERVHANRRRVAGLAGGRLAQGRQVHGAGVRRVAESGEVGEIAPADGQATALRSVAPTVLVADCLPIALSGSGGAAILHCGWRGLAEGIIARGAERVAATAAAIGPGIGACCYEVGPEVSRHFESLGGGVVRNRRLNLAEAARRLLREAGVGEIESSDLCTSCKPELFFSHRRDGERTGRQGGVVILGEDG